MPAPRVMLLQHPGFERDLLAYVLKHERCAPVLAASPDEACTLLLDADIDLILVDVRFCREQAGERVLPRLKSSLGHAHVSVAVLGEPRDEEEVTHLLSLGAAEWLGRTGLSMESLLGRLRILLEHFDDAALARPDTAEESPEAPRQPLTRADVLSGIKSSRDITPFAFALTEALTSDRRPADATGAILRTAGRDPMLAVALLAEANRLRHDGATMLDLRKAVELIGVRTVHRLLEEMTPLAEPPTCGFDLGRYWVHSLLTAWLAEMLARRLQIPVPSVAAVAGLVHDIGHYLLATRHPQTMQRLVQAAPAQVRATAEWEAALVGADHAEVGYWVLRYLGVPEILQHVVRVHESSPETWQALPPTVRVLAIIVRAADLLADAMYPGEPLLVNLANVPEPIESAARKADFDTTALLGDARKLMAELLTEMTCTLPRASGGPPDAGVRQRKPFQRLTYFAPNPRQLDTVAVFLHARAHDVQVVRRIREGMSNDGSPMVINLSHLPELNAQIESLSSAMAAGLMTNRRGIVLVPDTVDELHRSLVGPTWLVLPTPTQPAYWMSWLEKPLSPAAQSEETLVA